MTLLPFSTFHVTFLGSGTGLRPIRDILPSLQKKPLKAADTLTMHVPWIRATFSWFVHSSYQTLQMISPPNLALRASRPVINPLGVERIVIPKPARTQGMSRWLV